MYLSDRDLRWAIEKGLLLVDPGLTPDAIGPSSIDLRLDSVAEAKVWNLEKLRERNRRHGWEDLEIRPGGLRYQEISEEFLISPPSYIKGDETQLVALRGVDVIVRPGGFLIWQVKGLTGTPKENPRFICFIDGKSTRARTGLVVHLTAPTIHVGWSGMVALEITNLGPLTFAFQEDDVIAQLTVATCSSSPERSHEQLDSATLGQLHVTGRPGES